MTPDEARDLLDNFDRLLPFEADLEIEGAAKDMARMIAGMRTEYRMEVRDQHGKWHHDMWADDPARCVDPSFFGLEITARRLVRRYVTTPEEA